MKTYRLEDGKYEIDRDDQTGLMVAVRRNGEPWPEGFDDLRFMKVVGAMLNRIDELQQPREDLREAFEAWYIDHAREEVGVTFTPEEMVDLRRGDHYGDQYTHLNGAWLGFQAGRKA